jgi:hypothetical protein
MGMQRGGSGVWRCKWQHERGKRRDKITRGQAARGYAARWFPFSICIRLTVNYLICIRLGCWLVKSLVERFGHQGHGSNMMSAVTKDDIPDYLNFVNLGYAM